MKFYAVELDARYGYTMGDGHYYSHAVDAWNHAQPDRGYIVAITVYDSNNKAIKRINKRSHSEW